MTFNDLLDESLGKPLQRTMSASKRFKKPLQHKDPTKSIRLAFLVVKSMLSTGLEAPIERSM